MSGKKLEDTLAPSEDGLRRTYLERERRQKEMSAQLDRDHIAYMEKDRARRESEKLARSAVEKVAINVSNSVYDSGFVVSGNMFFNSYADVRKYYMKRVKDGSLFERIFGRLEKEFDFSLAITHENHDAVHRGYPEHYTFDILVVEPIIAKKSTYLFKKTESGKCLCEIKFYFDKNGKLMDDYAPSIKIFGEESVAPVLGLEKKLVSNLKD